MSMGDSSRIVAVIAEQLGPDVKFGAEIGVFRGETSVKLLSEFKSLHLFMVDAWTVYAPDDPYRKSGDGCAKLTADEQDANRTAAVDVTKFAAHRRTIQRHESGVAARHHAQPLDFVFLDGDHTFSGVYRDLEIWHPHVRPGGIVALHDMGSPRDLRGIWGVTKAFMKWTSLIGVPFSQDGTIGWYRK